MTTATDLDITGLQYDNVGKVWQIDIDGLNQYIGERAVAEIMEYPTWDNPSDNFEKFLHLLLIVAYLKQNELGNNTYNIKIGTISPSISAFGTRGNLSAKTIPVTLPFNSIADILGDTDSLG